MHNLHPSFLWVYYELTKWLAPRWLDSSVGRALHRHRRGHGFKSVQAWILFQALISQLLKLCVQLRWSIINSLRSTVNSPGMTRDDLFNTNASIVQTLTEACAKWGFVLFSFLILPGFCALFEWDKVIISYSFCYLNTGFAPRLSFALSQIL